MLIRKENLFQFTRRNYLQIHGTAMGTKMAVAFANIFMADIVSQSVVKPTVWKRFIDDIFSLWDTDKHDIERFIEQANSDHPTIKFTAEISNAETTFLYTKAISPLIIPYWLLKHISNRLKPFSTRIFPLATHLESNKDSSSAKPEDSYEKTPQKQHLRKKIKNK